MSLEWYKAFGLFALAVIALSFINESAAITVVLVVGFASILRRVSVGR